MVDFDPKVTWPLMKDEGDDKGILNLWTEEDGVNKLGVVFVFKLKCDLRVTLNAFLCVGLVFKFEEGNWLEEWGEPIDNGFKKDEDGGRMEGSEGLDDSDCSRWEKGGGFERLMKDDIEIRAKNKNYSLILNAAKFKFILFLYYFFTIVKFEIN